MKQKPSSGLGPLPLQILIALVICSLVITSCKKKPEPCEKCNKNFAKERKVKFITHYDASSVVKEKYRYFYHDNLIDSVYLAKYNTPSDSIVQHLKVWYPEGFCIPSAYRCKTFTSGPTTVEKGMMTLNGKFVLNKHLAFYPDQNFLGVTKNGDIDYTYNASGQVTTRKGNDFGLPNMFPSPYDNISAYTYTGDNVTKIKTLKEQAGYDLDITFDSKNSPFNTQANAWYYLFLTSYPDMEYFETLCLDKNNPTEIKFQGTDTSNSTLSIVYTFTYSYDASNYPEKVTIQETKTESMVDPPTVTVTNLGTYTFAYY